MINPKQVPEMLQDQQCLQGVKDLSRQAGHAILDIYERDHIQVTRKQDQSPLTQADTAAHQIIVHGLANLTPGIPVLSEESDPPNYAQRSSWHSYWLVDPLDGTREFVEKNNEFTVNIALIHRGFPVFGVVFLPVKDQLYTGVQFLETGGWPDHSAGTSQAGNTAPASLATRQTGSAEPEQIRVRALQGKNALTVVASRRHQQEPLQSCLSRLRQAFSDLTVTNMGSSLKICLVAEGSADIYPRYGPTCEWDTAAAQAVLEAAGGMLVDANMKPLRYNHKDDLLNPDFYAIGDVRYHWAALLRSRTEGDSH